MFSSVVWSIVIVNSEFDGLTFFRHLPCRFRYGSTDLLHVPGSPCPVLPTPSSWGNSAFLGDIAVGPSRWRWVGFLVGVPLNIRELGDLTLEELGAVSGRRGIIRVWTPPGYENPALQPLLCRLLSCLLFCLWCCLCLPWRLRLCFLCCCCLCWMLWCLLWPLRLCFLCRCCLRWLLCWLLCYLLRRLRLCFLRFYCLCWLLCCLLQRLRLCLLSRWSCLGCLLWCLLLCYLCCLSFYLPCCLFSWLFGCLFRLQLGGHPLNALPVSNTCVSTQAGKKTSKPAPSVQLVAHSSLGALPLWFQFLLQWLRRPLGYTECPHLNVTFPLAEHNTSNAIS